MKKEIDRSILDKYLKDSLKEANRIKKDYKKEIRGCLQDENFLAEMIEGFNEIKTEIRVLERIIEDIKFL